MKILHLIHAYSPAIGGSEYLVKQVAEYLANEAGDDVTVFTTFAYNSGLFTGRSKEAMPETRKHETINNVKVRRFPVTNRWAKLLYIIQYILYRLRFPGNGFWRMLYYGPISPQMKQAVMESDADIIVCAPFPLNHMSYGFKNRKKAPVVLTGCMHTADRHGFHNPRIEKLVRKAHGYIALTRHEKEFLVQKWGVDEEKITVIGVGIEERAPEPPAKVKKIREIAGFPQDAPMIAFVGQHGLHKGIDTLIKAMPAVWQESPGARLLIAGGATPFTEDFKKLAADAGREYTAAGGGARIFFLDNIDEDRKYEILEACDIFASPSGFESFGITLLEAWSKKKPVVACDILATRSLIQHDKTGFLAEYRDHRQLAGTLIKLLQDPALRERTGANGFEKWRKNYTKSIIGKQYRGVYGKILLSSNKT